MNPRQIVIEMFKDRAGRMITLDEIAAVFDAHEKTERNKIVVYIHRAVRYAKKKGIIIERTSKLGRGNKSTYFIPKEMADEKI